MDIRDQERVQDAVGKKFLQILGLLLLITTILIGISKIGGSNQKSQQITNSQPKTYYFFNTATYSLPTSKSSHTNKLSCFPTVTDTINNRTPTTKIISSLGADVVDTLDNGLSLYTILLLHSPPSPFFYPLLLVVLAIHYQPATTLHTSYLYTCLFLPPASHPPRTLLDSPR